MFLLAGKILIAILAWWLIYSKIFSGGQNSDYFDNLLHVLRDGNSSVMVSVVFLLMLCNWSIETLKWKFLIDRLETLPFIRAFSAVWIGLTISFFTPNRIGEYAGRVTVLSPGKRLAGSMITIVENTGQLAVTLVTGFLALTWYSAHLLSLPQWMNYTIAIFSIVFSGLIIFLYLNIKGFSAQLIRLKWLRKYQDVIESATAFTYKDLLNQFIFSLLRYAVFSLQFYLLIQLFGGKTEWIQSFPLIALGYFIMTVIPTVALTELGVRGAVMVYLFSSITYDPLPVMNASFALWLINLALPSAIGAFLILITKWKMRN